MDRQPAHIRRDESYRDSISTVDKAGKRIWVYPRKSHGKFTTWRAWFGYGLLALLFAGPFISIGGEPLLMINFVERRFVFFGQVFWPQDFLIFVLGFITFIVFVALFTVVFGRLFCGWACPQSVFMDQVFRRIEHIVEGDWKQRQALDKGPLTTDKLWKKTVKHVLFFSISFLIGNTFLAYIIGSHELMRIVTEPAAEHAGGLLAMMAFSGTFYANFAFFREQACTTVCPYGRLQGVLMDRKTIVIAYDHVRGEARGLFRKGEVRTEVGKGDCIDCKACVYECPTGIDIRNGTQLECVNCTACIDACDHMMRGVGLPTGLIRYASEDEIADKKPFRFTVRMKAYTAVLAVLVGVLATLIVMRTDTETTVLRTPGMLFQTQEDGRISNLYSIKTMNKTPHDLPVHLELMNVEGEIKVIGKPMDLKAGELGQGEVFILLDKDQLQGMKTKVVIGVYVGDKLLEKVSTSFVGPININPS
ncbi:MAG: cytochrome c oxidase accessory protein CcoG [Flavobacteriales bacterium]|nr:cytochrome c oxidase accessory protein CcoG [Flavobacteriales bacterium]MBK6754711.1 cytochrome c oxidase accessory protein CcoG [Flavobacteriales bacterium]MBK9074563.1 cytochrome c oxidase accessory protein CcoG [Flavobacteriales bacterium]